MNAKLINQVKFAKGEEVAVVRSYDNQVLFISTVINPDTISVRKQEGKGFYSFLTHAATDGYCYGSTPNSNGMKIRKITEGDREAIAANKAKAEAERQARMEESFRKQTAAKEANEARMAAAWDCNINNWSERQLINTPNGQIHIVRFDKNPAYGAGRFETLILRFNQVENYDGKKGYRMAAAHLDGRDFSASSAFDVCDTKLDCFKNLLLKWW